MNRFFQLLVVAILVVTLVAFSYFIYEAESVAKLGELSKVLLPSFATLLTALVALFIYRGQRLSELAQSELLKSEEKERLAATIYKEIKLAETAIEEIRTQNLEQTQKYGAGFQPAIGEFSPIILPYESWSQNKHLFVKDLSSQHFDVIDSSFNAAIQAEDCRKWAVDLFRVQANQKAIAKVDAISQISKELVIEKLRVEKGISTAPNLIEEGLIQVKRKCETDFNSLINDPNFLFKPKELDDRGSQALLKFKPIINTPAGEALKSLYGEFSL